MKTTKKKYTKTKPLKTELIKWMDAAESNGWYNKDKSHEPCICHSVGFVVWEDDHIAVIATTSAFDYWYSTALRIPKGCIIKRTHLKAAVDFKWK